MIKTKDRMLDDQAQSIADHKEGLQDRDAEIQHLNENKAKQRDYYEDKLEQQREDAERHYRKETEELQLRADQQEEEIQDLLQAKQDAEDELKEKKNLI